MSNGGGGVDGALRFNGSYWCPTPPGDRDLLRLQEALPQP